MQELRKPPLRSIAYIGFDGDRLEMFGDKRKKGVCFTALSTLSADDTNLQLDPGLEEDDELHALKELLAGARPLEFLQMSLAQYQYLMPHVSKIEFGLHITGDGVFEIPNDLVFERARYLWLDGNRVGFQARQTPSLEFLSAKCDRAKHIFDVAREAPNLVSLHLAACPAELDDASISRIKSLQISGSPMRRLPFEIEMPNIETLWLHSLNNLESLEVLKRLPNLSTLKLYYCGKAKDYESIINLPTLKTVDIVGCKPAKASRKLFEAKNINVVNFT